MVVIGCGGEAPRSVTLNIERGTEPVYVVARDVGGEWSAGSLIGIDGTISHYDLGPRADDYDVLFACEGKQGATSAVAVMWSLDAGDPAWPCPPPRPENPIPGPHVVTGTMRQAGSFALGEDVGEWSSGANWSFSVNPPDGTFDLLASSDASTFGGSPRMVMRRGIEVTSDVTLPEIDLDTEGVVARQFDMDVATSDEHAASYATWTTANGPVGLPGIGPFFLAPGLAQVTDGDRLDLHLIADANGSPSTYRELITPITDGLDRKSPLLPLLSSSVDLVWSVTAAGALHAEWNDLGVADYQAMHVHVSTHEIVMSKARVDEQAQNVAELDTSAPGFEDTWRIPQAVVDAGGFDRLIEVVTRDGDTTRTSGVRPLQ